MHGGGCVCFLGTNAEPAIPQLTKLLHGDPGCQLEVTKALLSVGPKGFEALTNVVNNPNDSARNTVIWAVGEYHGGDEKAITRILVSVLKDELGESGQRSAISGRTGCRVGGSGAHLVVEQRQE